MSRLEGNDFFIQDFLQEHHESTSGGLQQALQDSCILLTGVTGFLGSILLEKILRSCSSVNKVFVFIRPKDEKSAIRRFKEVSSKRLFDRLKMEDSSALTKVVVIAFNPKHTGLGLSQVDLKHIKSSVNIVIHAGLAQHPSTTFKDAVYANLNTTRGLLLLARQMPRLESFVHVSSVLCFPKEKMIGEVFYPAPISAKSLLAAVEYFTDDILEKIAPSLLCDFPTACTLTQAVAEDVVRLECKGLPLAIVRAPFLVATCKDPLAGWSHAWGPTGVAAQIMLGYIRVLHCDPHCLAEIVPADTAANLIISVAGDTARSRQDWTNEETEMEKEEPLFSNISVIESEVPIYNLVSSTQRQISWSDYFNCGLEQAAKVPFSSAVWHPKVYLIKNRLLYILVAFLFHILPPYLVDTMAYLLGGQSRLLDKYKELSVMSNSLSLYAVKQQRYRDSNTRDLWRRMSPVDHNTFNFNLYLLDWDEYFYTQCRGIRVYLLGDSLESVPSGKLRLTRLKVFHYLLSTCIATFIVFLVLYLKLPD